MGFFKGALKIAVAIVLSIVALSILGGIAAYIYENHQKSKATPYEVVKRWSFDATEPLGLKLTGKTKLVDNSMYIDLLFSGNPPYLKYASNRPDANRQITIYFKDKDGFKVYEKSIGLHEFTTMVDKGTPVGLAFEFDVFMALDTYARFDHIDLTWNLDTAEPKLLVDSDVLGQEKPDHCAPNLSKAERLKRLARHGTLRETGLNEYSAGGRSIHFLNSSELLSCR
jgi:hypothetical protein